MTAIMSMAQGVGSGLQGVKGVIQERQAKKIIASHPRPDYEIKQGVIDNLNLAKYYGQEGLSDKTKQLYSNSAERGYTSAMDAILKGGGNVNNIADLYSNYDAGVNKFAMMDEEARVRNIRGMMDQNSNYAAEQDKEWQINEWAPYADAMQTAASLKQQGAENIGKGISGMIGAGANMASSKLYKQEGDNVYPKTQPMTAEQTAAQKVRATYPGLGTGYGVTAVDNGSDYVNPYDE